MTRIKKIENRIENYLTELRGGESAFILVAKSHLDTYACSDLKYLMGEVKRLQTKLGKRNADVQNITRKNERLRGHLDDACECARCCECSGMVDDCRIMATKKIKAENGGTVSNDS